MLTIHHLSNSQSERTIWLCEELDIAYQHRRYERHPETGLAPPELRALHPFGTAPVIEHSGVILGESAAIFEYILAKYGNGKLAVGPDHPNFADYLYWFHFANASMSMSMVVDMIAQSLGGRQDDRIINSLQPRVDRALNMIDRRLATNNYFAGAGFTAADIMNVYGLTTVRSLIGRELTNLPNLRAYLARIGERPAYQRAMHLANPGQAPKLT